MTDLSGLTPGCVIVAHDGDPIETYPPRCPCGCGTVGLAWAMHDTSHRDESADLELGKIQFFEVIRRTVTRELRDSVVIGEWVVRPVGQSQWGWLLTARKQGKPAVV